MLPIGTQEQNIMGVDEAEARRRKDGEEAVPPNREG